MSEIVNQSLQKIAKGTGIIFIGTIIGLLLGFIGRVIIVRYITQSEYGIYSLALVIISIFVTISTLGLQEGSARYIAYFRGKNEEGKVRGVISSSIKIAIIASISLAVISFFISDFISASIFHASELSTPLKIFSIAIPFTVLVGVFIAIFRGFDRVEPSVYFQKILRNILFILFLIVVVLSGLSFLGVICAYLASLAVTCVAFAIYVVKKSPLPIKREKNLNANPIGKELLLFSLPLLGAAFLFQIMTWTDTLMLGYFKTSDIVGLYNGAVPLAQLLLFFITGMNFLYIPVMTQLYAQNQMSELRRSYQVLTKWIFSATLPFFLLFLLFSETILNFLFGSGYIGAAVALQILALGYFVHAFLGPNGNTLVVMGKPKLVMWAVLISVILNIILNISLIPVLGIAGAAIATASAFLIENVIIAVKLYSLSKIQPFTKNCLKPIVASLIPFFIIYELVKDFITPVPSWMLLVALFLFLGTYGLAVLLTKSFDDEDITMLLTIEKRLGINLTSIKRILKKFI